MDHSRRNSYFYYPVASGGTIFNSFLFLLRSESSGTTVLFRSITSRLVASDRKPSNPNLANFPTKPYVFDKPL